MPKKTTEEITTRENHLDIIKASLQNSAVKDGSKTFIADKDKLVFKIVDKLKVTPAKAREYLKILESRNVVQLGRKEVIFIPKSKQEIEEEVNSYFENVIK